MKHIIASQNTNKELRNQLNSVYQEIAFNGEDEFEIKFLWHLIK